MIIGVAIKTPDDHIHIRLPKPNRHHHCFRAAEAAGIDLSKTRIGTPADCQGFYTHDGRYLNRELALRHVRRCGQRTIEHPVKYLFSEDLW